MRRFVKAQNIYFNGGNKVIAEFFPLQNLQVVPVPRESVGKFYNGDAYIIYSSTAYGQAGGPSVQA